jgi:hypothetical protein
MDIKNRKHLEMNGIYRFLPRLPFQFIFMFLFVIIIAIVLAMANSTKLRDIENLRKGDIVVISYFLMTSLPLGAISGYFLEQIIQLESITYPDDPLLKKIYRNLLIHIKFTISNILVILLIILFNTTIALLYSLIAQLDSSTLFLILTVPIVLFSFFPSLFWAIPSASLATALAYSLLRKLFYKPTR